MTDRVIPGPARHILSVLLVLALAAQHAHADIVFETYDIRRPDEADAPVGAFLHALSKHGSIAEPRDVMDQLGNQATHPAIATPKLTAHQLLVELSAAHARWTKAQDFRTVVPALAALVSKAFDNPALVVTDEVIRGELQKVLLDLALGYGKLAHELETGPKPSDAKEEAKLNGTIKQLRRLSEETMAEWIRTFNGEVITQNGNGPEAEKLYLHVRDDFTPLGRGVLALTIDDPNVQLYVNETIRLRRQAIPDLLPGRYRVLAMGPNDDAQLFLVDVLPNQTTRLDIRWAISSNLISSPSSVALVFRQAKHPEPAQLACQLARSAGHSRGGVVIVGTDIADSQWRMTASQYDIRTCRLMRSGYVVLTKLASAKSAQALAEFIATGAQDPDVVVTSDEDLAVFQTIENMAPSTPAVVDDPAPRARPAWLPWTAAGTSVAMFVIGGYLINRGNTDCAHGLQPDCKVNPALLPAGFTGLDLGVASGALALYWISEHPRPENLPSKWLVIGGAVAATAGVIAYAYDQDPGHTDSSGRPTKYYWNTAPVGVALTALGLASAGVGVWSWTLKRHVSSVPTITASSSQAMLGLAGHF